MHKNYQLSVRVTNSEIEPVLDRLDEWFMIGRPDGFFDCDSINPHVHSEGAETWVSVGFPAAEDEIAAFMASLAAQECGLGGMRYVLSEAR